MALSAGIRNRTRVGSGVFTVFYFMGKALAKCQQVNLTTARPVGAGAVAIQPMDEPYPVEIITPAAAGMGSFTLNMYELYGSKIWERLGAEVQSTGSTDHFNTSFNDGGILNGLNDIVDIFIKIAAQDPSTMHIVKYIYPPNIASGTIASDPTTNRGTPYYEVYHNCVVTDVRDGEQIEVGTMEILKQIDIAYTYVTRNGSTPLAFSLRNPGASTQTS